MSHTFSKISSTGTVQGCLNPSICLDYTACKKGALNIQSCMGFSATWSSKRLPRQGVWNEMVCKAPPNLNLLMIQQCWTFSFVWTMISWAALLTFIAWQNFPCREQWEQSNPSQVFKACFQNQNLGCEQLRIRSKRYLMHPRTRLWVL